MPRERLGVSMRGPLRDRIVDEYREMPGLSLTASQASRLLGVDRYTCENALKGLAREGFLAKTRSGMFVLVARMSERRGRTAAYRRQANIPINPMFERRRSA